MKTIHFIMAALCLLAINLSCSHSSAQDIDHICRFSLKNTTAVDLCPNTASALRFWGGQDNISIRIGTGPAFAYGKVSSWAMKFSNSHVNSNNLRGWVWGAHNQTPIASLSSKGDMQLAGDHRILGKLDAGPTTFNGNINSHLRGWTLVDGEQASLFFGNDKTGWIGEFGIEYNTSYNTTGLNFWKPWGSNNGLRFSNCLFFISDWGDIGIGTCEPKAKLHIPQGNVFIGDVDLANCTDCGDYRMFVRKGIRTEKVKVDVANGVWADYVFSDDYKLNSLEEVQAFIQKNGHLPGLPSAEEVQKEGINLAEMDAKLLEKIEELTLYVLELKNENQVLNDKIEALSNNLTTESGREK